MLAAFTGAAELALDEKESRQLADALEAVGRHYAIEATEKSIAWINLATTLGMLYGPRAVTIGRRKAEQAKQAAPKPFVVGRAASQQQQAAAGGSSAGFGGFTQQGSTAPPVVNADLDSLPRE